MGKQKDDAPAIGSFETVTAALPDVSRLAVRRSMRWWCHKDRYLRATTAPGVRPHLLNGEAPPAPEGIITGDRRSQTCADLKRRRRAERDRNAQTTAAA